MNNHTARKTKKNKSKKEGMAGKRSEQEKVRY